MSEVLIILLILFSAICVASAYSAAGLILAVLLIAIAVTLKGAVIGKKI